MGLMGLMGLMWSMCFNVVNVGDELNVTQMQAAWISQIMYLKSY